ncbi:MAG: helix-turn-helix transcriptional regulator [Leptolyngbyaceae cyanobacterium SM1_4_3]|nr:helix-turn-helix transcriptional regulator [Leptolyngbyaceae cyanobacterium SM1_4_3]
MTEAIAHDTYRQQWEESVAAGNGEILYGKDGFDCVGRCDHYYSQDYFWEIQLRPGFWLEFIDDEIHRSLDLLTEHDESMPLVSKFYLSGHHPVLTPNVKGVNQEYEEKAGQSYLFFLPDIQEIERFPVHQRLQLVKVCFDLDYLRSLGADSNVLPDELQQFFGDKPLTRFHCATGALTLAMQAALRQILDCPYQGIIKRLFLESKALELLTLQLHQWAEQHNPSTDSRTLHADDVERLYHAREILMHDIQNPPSLMDLARQVGLNDYKLKAGFRQIFGTTVFGYLQTCRMERAKQLLAERQLSIAAIAHTVGYASQSRFCHAFKQRYGMTPIACRKAS